VAAVPPANQNHFSGSKTLPIAPVVTENRAARTERTGDDGQRKNTESTDDCGSSLTVLRCGERAIGGELRCATANPELTVLFNRVILPQNTSETETETSAADNALPMVN
jgi:hypothetical protein